MWCVGEGIGHGGQGSWAKDLFLKSNFSIAGLGPAGPTKRRSLNTDGCGSGQGLGMWAGRSTGGCFVLSPDPRLPPAGSAVPTLP